VRERFRAQLLSGPPARDVVEAVERLLAVQAQDPRGARLAVRARTRGLSAADVDRALTVDRSVVIGWLNRGTLHLVRAEDYAWLHAVTTPQLRRANERRLAQEGVTPAAADRGVAVVERALADEGPLTRLQLRDRLRAANVRTEGQALVHVLVLASLRGIAVRGPIAGRQHAYALVHDWLGPAPDVDRESALRELARRYLRGHGPADERDLAKWAGITVREARAGLAAVSPVRSGNGSVPAPKLLGPFDPVLLGWASRGDVVGRHEGAIVTGGVFRPFALVDGRAAGVWRFAEGRPELSPLRRLTRDERAAIDAEAADVVRFLSGA
jgi:hypothetical protein